MIVLFITYHFSDIGPKKVFFVINVPLTILPPTALIWCICNFMKTLLDVLKNNENIRNTSFSVTQAVGDLWMDAA